MLFPNPIPTAAASWAASGRHSPACHLLCAAPPPSPSSPFSRVHIRGAQLRDCHHELLAPKRRDDAERAVHLLLGQREEQLAVDSMRLERLDVIAQLLSVEPRARVRHLPCRWVCRVDGRGGDDRHNYRRRGARERGSGSGGGWRSLSLLMRMGRVGRRLLGLHRLHLLGQRLVLERPAKGQNVDSAKDAREPHHRRVVVACPVLGSLCSRHLALSRNRAHQPPHLGGLAGRQGEGGPHRARHPG
mmetsp:Transcript_15662/g.49782  ORF Transcript_15662/g.49782 Transcript_15662/m.49782 type:complete len:245 (+) Transcript_15662:397-1131(+)